MTRKHVRFAQLALGTILLLVAGLIFAGGGTGTFYEDVFPILNTDYVWTPGIPSCSTGMCHGPPMFFADLDTTSYAGIMAGGESGPIVVPGDSHASLLRKYLRNNRMPFGVAPSTSPDGPNFEVLAFVAWIDDGALETGTFNYDSDGDGIPDSTGSYTDTIRPLLDTEEQWGFNLLACTNAACHDAVDPAIGLDLTTYGAIMAGAHDGTEPVVYPADGDGSPIVTRMRRNRMPYGVPTSVPRNGPNGEVNIIAAWIDAGATEFDPFPLPGGPVLFIRGDSNRDGVIDIADPILTLSHLFGGVGPLLTCEDAADGNDDGALDVADPVYILGFLFASGPVPSAPFPDPGTDPTTDPLTCDS